MTENEGIILSSTIKAIMKWYDWIQYMHHKKMVVVFSKRVKAWPMRCGCPWELADRAESDTVAMRAFSRHYSQINNQCCNEWERCNLTELSFLIERWKRVIFSKYIYSSVNIALRLPPKTDWKLWFWNPIRLLCVGSLLGTQMVNLKLIEEY